MRRAGDEDGAGPGAALTRRVFILHHLIKVKLRRAPRGSSISKSLNSQANRL